MARMNRLALFLFLGLLLAACATTRTVRGSGKIISRELSLTGFSKVEVGDGFEVIITAGPAISASVEVDDNLVPFLRLCREDDTLKIRLASGRSYDTANLPFKVRITMPVLTALQLSGASRATLVGFHSA